MEHRGSELKVDVSNDIDEKKTVSLSVCPPSAWGYCGCYWCGSRAIASGRPQIAHAVDAVLGILATQTPVLTDGRHGNSEP